MNTNDGIDPKQTQQQTTSLILLLIIFIFGIFKIVTISFSIYFRLTETTPQLELIPNLEALSEQQLRDRARNVTVRVIIKNGSGSGVLIGNQNERYQLITNQHVIRSPNDTSYKVETPDGELYSAKRVNEVDFSGKDLAVLEFQAPNQDYETIPFGNSQQVREGQTVIAAGFPSQQRGEPITEALEITQGNVSLLPPKPLEDGYYIGYTNRIQKGMSGGPLLNIEGELIAVNGMHAYPIWGDPYVYQNGEQPSKQMREKMRKFSWGIPSHTFKRILTKH